MSGSDDVAYEPVSVKEVLGEMKDIAELLVDLAYSSVLFEDPQLAEEALELEARSDVLQLRARMSLVLAGRNPREAEQLAPIFGIVGAAEKISDAAGDVAKVVLDDMGLPPAFHDSLPEAMETLARADVDPDSRYAGSTLGELGIETETGVRIIALRRGDEWILDPDRETRLRAGDVALCRGPQDAIAGVFETMTGDPFRQPDREASPIEDLDRAVTSVVTMKNMSELAVDLAYGSVLFDSPALAEEVRDLEVEVDALRSRFEVWALRAAGAVDDPASIRGLLRIATSTEVISDAALEISEGVLRGLGSHPVVQAAVDASDEGFVSVSVGADSDLDGRTVEDIRTRMATGVRVVAIRRAADDDTPPGTDWLVSPTPETELRRGDTLIAKGTRTGTEQLAELAT